MKIKELFGNFVKVRSKKMLSNHNTIYATGSIFFYKKSPFNLSFDVYENDKKTFVFTCYKATLEYYFEHES